MRYLFLANVAASLYLLGVIWTVQLAHYFLFDKVGAADWLTYHRLHTRQMSLVVVLPMVIQLGSACFLALFPPTAPALPRWFWSVGAFLVVATWAATFFISVPLHATLGNAFDADACRALVRTNWIRTVLWSAQAVLMMEAVRRVLDHRAPGL
jgi:hypothetical protein